MLSYVQMAELGSLRRVDGPVGKTHICVTDTIVKPPKMQPTQRVPAEQGAHVPVQLLTRKVSLELANSISTRIGNRAESTRRSAQTTSPYLVVAELTLTILEPLPVIPGNPAGKHSPHDEEHLDVSQTPLTALFNPKHDEDELLVTADIMVHKNSPRRRAMLYVR